MQEAYEVSTGVDPRPALALGGGIGHAGDVCGAVSGGAIAVGQLFGDHIADLQEAKLYARKFTLPFYRDFVAEFGHADCVSLIGMEIASDEGFRAFLQSNLKKDRCTLLLDFALDRLLPLRDEVGGPDAS